MAAKSLEFEDALQAHASAGINERVLSSSSSLHWSGLAGFKFYQFINLFIAVAGGSFPSQPCWWCPRAGAIYYPARCCRAHFSSSGKPLWCLCAFCGDSLMGKKCIDDFFLLSYAETRRQFKQNYLTKKNVNSCFIQFNKSLALRQKSFLTYKILIS